MRHAALLALLAPAVLAPTAAGAQVELQLYLGAQGALGDEVELDEPRGVGRLSFDPEWEGRSFEAPPVYGLRATAWRTQTVGLGVEFNHQKVYADDDVLDALSVEQLEFTDGLNFLTVHAVRRFPRGGRITPYVGAGVGVVLPWVEVDTARGTGSTDELQLGGPAAVAFAGASYALDERWSAFAEVKGTASRVEGDLDGGGSVEADILTGAINVGLGVRF